MAMKVETIQEAREVLKELDPKFLDEIRDHATAFSDQSVILYADALSCGRAKSSPRLVEIGVAENGEKLWTVAC